MDLMIMLCVIFIVFGIINAIVNFTSGNFSITWIIIFIFLYYLLKEAN